jgi:hypothetical protein
MYREYKSPMTGTIRTLLCYWRHKNPWEYYILDGNMKKGKIIEDIGDGLSCDSPIENVQRFGQYLLLDYYLNIRGNYEM